MYIGKTRGDSRLERKTKELWTRSLYWGTDERGETLIRRRATTDVQFDARVVDQEPQTHLVVRRETALEKSINGEGFLRYLFDRGFTPHSNTFHSYTTAAINICWEGRWPRQSSRSCESSSWVPHWPCVWVQIQFMLACSLSIRGKISCIYLRMVMGCPSTALFPFTSMLVAIV